MRVSRAIERFRALQYGLRVYGKGDLGFDRLFYSKHLSVQHSLAVISVVDLFASSGFLSTRSQTAMHAADDDGRRKSPQVMEKRYMGKEDEEEEKEEEEKDEEKDAEEDNTDEDTQGAEEEEKDDGEEEENEEDGEEDAEDEEDQKEKEGRGGNESRRR
jgi:hypothetical protein